MKKIVFVSGTRADFSKIKSLMLRLEESSEFELHIFATGMHLSKQFGLTVKEIEKSNFKNIYKFINHDRYYQMDLALSHTIDGFSKFIAEYEPDLIVVHGDRVEPLAASIVGALNNILVAHIEGGEVFGTIDDSIRHAISKLAHIHLVNDLNAKKRLLQLGENADSIFIIGSPDLDILDSDSVCLNEAKRYYDVDFADYGIVMFHPVTTELDSIKLQADELVAALKDSGENYIMIYPNNDLGFNLILESYKAIRDDVKFRFYPSIRFEYFVALLKGAKFCIGNSSCLLKEAPHLGIPSINIGTRQSGRMGSKYASVFHTNANKIEILNAIKKANNFKHTHIAKSKRAKSNELFFDLLQKGVFFDIDKQKQFKDIQ